jgi:hypothetical protein
MISSNKPDTISTDKSARASPFLRKHAKEPSPAAKQLNQQQPRNGAVGNRYKLR